MGISKERGEGQINPVKCKTCINSTKSN